MSEIYKICFTGGPCGGKTTALDFVSAGLRAHGYDVLRVPESATLAAAAGANLAIEEKSRENQIRFQSALANLQQYLETTLLDIAKQSETGKPTVILCDRGPMDCRAFCSPDVWEEILIRNKWSNPELRDNYDAVFHLTTAAVGAEESFGNATNKHRREDATRAAVLDRLLLNAWTGHPHLREIPNGRSFNEKLLDLTNQVLKVCSPHPTEIERRFLVTSAEFPSFVHLEEADIVQTYLTSTPGRFSRVRQRTMENVTSYTFTMKDKKENAQGSEIEIPIDHFDYTVYLQSAHPEKRPINKKRKYFFWGGKYMELDTFVKPFKGMMILEVELQHRDEKIMLPPFLKVEKEVTDDNNYSNWTLASQL